MIPSLIRTIVPLLVAYLVGWLASLGIAIDDDTQTLITTGIGTVVAALYYAVVRWAETRWPAVSILLGSARQPTYLASSVAVTKPDDT